MPYLVTTTYRAGQQALRDQLLMAHVDYLDQHIDVLLAAGGLVNDENTQAQAAMYIVATEDRAVAQAFIDHEPFVVGGLIEQVTVQRWRKSYFDGKRLLGDPLRTSSTSIGAHGAPPLSGASAQ